jgi:hypothetical protein
LLLHEIDAKRDASPTRQPAIEHNRAAAGIAKDELARQVVQRDKIKEGLIAIFSAVEPCLSYSVRGDHQTKQIKLVLQTRKFTHFYHYYLHQQFDLLHVRVQSWFPFSVDVCLNGREWLARQMDSPGIGYEKRDNCFVALGDPVAAQELCLKQLQTDWAARRVWARSVVRGWISCGALLIPDPMFLCAQRSIFPTNSFVASKPQRRSKASNCVSS